MKYKAVITGMQRNLVEDLYLGLESIESVTSSIIKTDVEKHIKFYNPELLILCLNDDSVKMGTMISSVQRLIDEKEIVVVVIGAQEEIDAYREVTLKEADIYLAKPLKNSIIMATINEFMEEREQMKEELRLLEEKKLAEANRPHILIVDDDPNMLAMLKGFLEKDYKVATAVNGGLALRFLSKKSTDLILLDYEMPVQSGPQVMTILRNNEATKDVPVVFLTGVQDASKIAKVLELKPQGYLLKPIDTKRLMETVKSILG